MDRANPTAADALRRLPSIDALLRIPAVVDLPRGVVVREARRLLDELRAQVLAGRCDGERLDATFAPGGSGAGLLRERCELAQVRHHRRVINATGVILHTGIGRAPLAQAARDAVLDATGYAIVEIDPMSGARNQREDCVAELLRDLLGVPGALVVNNNAAMVNLVLRALTEGVEVIVSRGELVEIGGGFRMSDVMARAGCKLVEVGATNRTHLRDYRDAITASTGMLLKVHTSNYRIVGFHGVPTLEELVALGREAGIPVFEDLGSGLLLEDELPGLEHEIRVPASVRSGAELICFSGDKLLGGPQCGILVGDAELCRKVRAHPLYRAMRLDKLALAALEATLRIYRDGDPLTEIPTLAAITRPAAQLRPLAEDLAERLKPLGARVMASESFVGSGANPARPIPSFAVTLPGGQRVAAALRAGPECAVIARVADDLVWLDARTLMHEDLAEVAGLVLRRVDPLPQNGTNGTPRN